MSLEKIVANLVEKVERHFYGKYRGFVVENADPEKLGRLKLRVPSILGNEVVTGWAMPCVPYGGDANQGMLFIPEVDAGVWVEFEEGDLEFPIWVGTFWSKPGGESELPFPNQPDGSEDSAVQDPPTRKIIKTLEGHTIQFEDGNGDPRIIISDGQSENLIVFEQKGISITNKNNSIKLTDKGIVIKDTNSNILTQDANGIVIQDKNKNKITMDALSGGIPGNPGTKINGEKKVCLEGLITWLMSHTHIGNMGAPCPLNPADIAKLAPLLAAPDGDILSQKVKLG
jgi:uncharacterized protein involved in type VI secretion and phage assembly